jgi:hypothetical protein
VITKLERGDEWLDMKVASARPPAPMSTGQIIILSAPLLPPTLRVTIEVGDMDPQRRWIDLLVRLPFGVDNHEHLTLTPTNEGGTLVRFN